MNLKYLFSMFVSFISILLGLLVVILEKNYILGGIFLLLGFSIKLEQDIEEIKKNFKY